MYRAYKTRDEFRRFKIPLIVIIFRDGKAPIPWWSSLWDWTFSLFWIISSRINVLWVSRMINLVNSCLFKPSPSSTSAMAFANFVNISTFYVGYFFRSVGNNLIFLFTLSQYPFVSYKRSSRRFIALIMLLCSPFYEACCARLQARMTRILNFPSKSISHWILTGPPLRWCRGLC
jgi:hypothetical protein